MQTSLSLNLSHNLPRPQPSPKALITYAPSVEDQERASFASGIGRLRVSFDVDRESDGGEIQVGEDHFVHFFAPTSLPPMTKFVCCCCCCCCCCCRVVFDVVASVVVVAFVVTVKITSYGGGSGGGRGGGGGRRRGRRDAIEVTEVINEPNFHQWTSLMIAASR